MLLILIPLTLLIVLTINLYRSLSKYPKGPTPLPLIGNVHQLVFHSWKTGGVVSGLNHFRDEYGKVFTLWFGPLPAVFITDFEVAHETHVKRSNIFGTRFAVGGMTYIREGRGIVTSTGDFWQEHRRFALTTLRNFGLGRNIMEERIMAELDYRIQDFQKTHLVNGAIEIQAASFFDLTVGSIINRLLVSERFEQDDEKFKKLKESLDKSLEQLSLFDLICPIFLLKSKLLMWRTKKVFAPFEYVYELAKSTIQNRVTAIENGEHVIEDDGTDFVDAFLVKIEKDKKEGIESTFTLDTLAIDIYDLWLAGQETTATTLSWAGVCLLNHPEVVSKLREELLKVTGGNRGLSLPDRPQTPYFNATINEVQRIASILNFNVSRCLEEDTVIDGQPVAAGAVYTANLSQIHTDEDLFKNHKQFRPERFLEDNNLEKKLIPFGIGKRSCPGESLARAELYLILGNICLNYNLEAVGEIPPIKSIAPFALMKRPPSYKIRFVPV